MSEPVGVALLGAAHTSHAWAYARALSSAPWATLVGVHDATREHARWVCQDFGVPFFDDPDELVRAPEVEADRKSTRLNSSHANISYAVFCLKKKKTFIHSSLLLLPDLVNLTLC